MDFHHRLDRLQRLARELERRSAQLHRKSARLRAHSTELLASLADARHALTRRRGPSPTGPPPE